MKIISTRPNYGLLGMTLMEVLVVLALLLILVLVCLPAKKTSPRRGSIYDCANNLKQIGFGLKLYADDNNDKYPFQTSVTNGGTDGLIGIAGVSAYFQEASNYFANEPRLLICPAAETRSAATSFATLTDSNISYFLNADAKTDAAKSSILAGDRFLSRNGKPLSPGLFALTASQQIGWTPGIHEDGGNILFSDGDVQFTTNRSFAKQIENQAVSTNRLLLP